MAHRTTLLLDDETRTAARELARQFGISVSEAIRRSVIHQRDLTVGLPAERRGGEGGGHLRGARASSSPCGRAIRGERPGRRDPKTQGTGRRVLVLVHLDTDFLVYPLSVRGPKRKRLGRPAGGGGG